MRHDRERLVDIKEAIDKINTRLESRELFESDEMLRIWCLHHIIVIGEAAAHVSDEFRTAHAEVPWRRIVAMRNAVVHGYFKVDWNQVWTVLEKELEPLNQKISALLD